MMSTEFDGRCSCTLADVGNGIRKKPLDGYIEPDPNCDICKGTGKNKFVMPEMGDDNVEAVWIGRCVVCGDENGVYFQIKGISGSPEDDCDRLPKCMNPECDNEFCSWSVV